MEITDRRKILRFVNESLDLLFFSPDNLTLTFNLNKYQMRKVQEDLNEEFTTGYLFKEDCTEIIENYKGIKIKYELNK